MSEDPGLNDPLIEIEEPEEAPPDIPKVRAFYATCAGGLEDVAQREIRDVLKGATRISVQRRQRLSRIHFRYERSPRRLLDLETVEAVFADLGTVGGVTTGRPGLLRLAEAISRVDLAPGVVLHNILHGEPERSGVAINCTVGRGHRFTASELHQVLTAVLADTYDLDETEQRGPYFLSVRLEGPRATIGFRLSRGSVPEGWRSLPGALSHPTARGIVRLVQPERRTRWVDVACGDGALCAAFSAAVAAGVTALDTRLEAVDAARTNCRGLPVCVAGVWDGRAIPVAGRSFDGVIAGLGRRRQPDAKAILAAAGRALAPYGRVVLLCRRDRDLESGLAEPGPFKLIQRSPVFAAGDSLSLYDLRTTAT